MKKLFFMLISSFCLSGILFADDSYLLPANTNEKGWVKISKPKIFSTSDLYGYIDGGAELFLEFGFEELTVQRYKNGAKAEMNIEIYRMSDQIASAGIFLMKCIANQQDTSFAEMHSINNYQISFRKDRYFIILSNQSGDQKYVPALIGFAKHIASLLQPDNPLPITESISKQNQIAGSLRLIRGPYALQSIYTLGDGNILQLNKSTTAIAADYKNSNGSAYTSIQIDYSDSTRAAKVFLFMRDKLDPYIKIISADDQTIRFQDFKKLYGIIHRKENLLNIMINLPVFPE